MDPKIAERSKNFKDSEVTLLLDLVDKYKNVLECKKTDHMSLKDKEKIWVVIEEEFNKISRIFNRDAKTLKKKYENLKKISKKWFADEKKYVCGTGRGPSKKTEITDTDIKVKNILGDLPVLGNQSQFDSDATYIDIHSANIETIFEEPLLDLSEVPVVLEEDIDRPSTPNQPTISGKFVASALKACQEISEPLGKLKETKKLGFGSSFTIRELRSKISCPLVVR